MPKDQDIFKQALAGSFLPVIAALTQLPNLIPINQIIEPDHGFTLLHAAAYHSNFKAVVTLLSLGADPNQIDFRG
ncbi:MAG: ankyrin repeat domain-containing protein [Flammeovirgaceae bacterium]